MRAILSGKIKLYAEMPTGEVCEITGMVSNFEVSQRYDMIDVTSLGDAHPNFIAPVHPMTTVTIEGDARWTTGEILNTRRTLMEWKCDYCGSPNPRHATHCRKCGAARSFIYG